MNTKNIKEIYFAGGCFWGVEAYMSKIPGVYETSVGYANGNSDNPTYEDVCYKKTGHAETVYIKYNPEEITLERLVSQFFKIIDPTILDRQGYDCGKQYRTGIYFTNEADGKIIKETVNLVQKEYQTPIVTEVMPLKQFFKAEEYHQKYLEKNPGGYCHIKFDSLKDFAKEKTSSYTKPDENELKNKLTPLQYEVTQSGGTERPFANEYWDNKRSGIYVDITTGEPLFSSKDKYDSHSGWPSFTKPLKKSVIREHTDDSHGMLRTEVKSNAGNAHLGHVFTDGPQEHGGLRYCINSASLRFVPLEAMEKEGYGELLHLLE